jgi:PTH1 family peptidyl-tRNA hydrolase
VPAVIVGLGNPGNSYRHTPHNVGHEVLDDIASRLGATWFQDELASLARAEFCHVPLLLVKPSTFVNDTGPALLHLAERIGFGSSNCLIVFDDVNLPCGTVRLRMNGSAGGHNGMQSIIAALESEAFPRIKIGVGRPGEHQSVAEFVLTPFGSIQREMIEKAYRDAATRALEHVAKTFRVQPRSPAEQEIRSSCASSAAPIP